MFVYLVYPAMSKSYKTVRLNLITLFSKVFSIPLLCNTGTCFLFEFVFTFDGTRRLYLSSIKVKPNLFVQLLFVLKNGLLQQDTT